MTDLFGNLNGFVIEHFGVSLIAKTSDVLCMFFPPNLYFPSKSLSVLDVFHNYFMLFPPKLNPCDVTIA